MADETQTFVNLSADTGAFALNGGAYSVLAQLGRDPHSTGPSGIYAGEHSVKLQSLGSDDKAWSSISKATDFSKSGSATVHLSGGKYRFAISNALLIQATIKSIS